MGNRKDAGPVTDVADIKDLVHVLEGFSTDEIKQIPLVARGTQLKEGAVYLDLANRAKGPFTAAAGITARENNYFVPKAEIPHNNWNRLLVAIGRQESTSLEQKGSPAAKSASAHGESISQEQMDKTLADSFPASDPPSWNLGRKRKRQGPEKKGS